MDHTAPPERRELIPRVNIAYPRLLVPGRIPNPSFRPPSSALFPVRRVIAARNTPYCTINNNKYSSPTYLKCLDGSGSLRGDPIVPRLPAANVSRVLLQPTEINVTQLASNAEHAIVQCRIVRNTQIWFEAILMTIGENMSCHQASITIGVNSGVLMRLINIVRVKMGWFPITSIYTKQFTDSMPLRDAPSRIIRLVRPNQPPPAAVAAAVTPAPAAVAAAPAVTKKPPEIQPNIANEKKSFESDDEEAMEVPSHGDVITGRNVLRNNLHEAQRDTQLDEHIAMEDAKMDVHGNEELRALSLATAVSLRTVLVEEKRDTFEGTMQELEQYFKRLLLLHKQVPEESQIRGLASIVANKKGILDDILLKFSLSRNLAKTMLRMALFERKFEEAEVKMTAEETAGMAVNEDEERNVKGSTQHWLLNTVVELAVPVVVDDFRIVMDLAEKKKDRACLKALYRYISPKVETDSTVRIAVERVVLVGYEEWVGITKEHYSCWCRMLKRILTLLLIEFTAYLDRWRKYAESRTKGEEMLQSRKQRSSSRIKEREATQSDSMYLDKIFQNNIRTSFMGFLRKLQCAGMPMSESTVVSIGMKIVSIFDEKKEINKETWSEWIQQFIAVEFNDLYDYMDKDD